MQLCAYFLLRLLHVCEMLIGLLECLNVSMWILVNVDVEGLSSVLSLLDEQIDSVQRKHM